jgi:hypothetical protein
MEALSSVVIVGLIVVGVVDGLKDLSPRVTGFVTVVVAALVGLLWALVDGPLGFVPDLTIAQGISAGLVASGAAGLAKKI